MALLCPLNINLQGKECLVCGGGNIAVRKVKYLLNFGALITVVSPKTTESIQILADQGLIKLIADGYEPDLLIGKFMAIAVTGKQDLDRQIARDCQERSILVCTAGEADRGDLVFPAYFSRGPLVITASSSGHSPHFAKRLCQELGDQYGSEYGEFCAFLGEIRDQVKAIIADQVMRRSIFIEIAGQEWFADYCRYGREHLEKKLDQLLADASA